MTELPDGDLIGLGTAAVVGVFGHNVWQETKPAGWRRR